MVGGRHPAPLLKLAAPVARRAIHNIVADSTKGVQGTDSLPLMAGQQAGSEMEGAAVDGRHPVTIGVGCRQHLAIVVGCMCLPFIMAPFIMAPFIMTMQCFVRQVEEAVLPGVFQLHCSISPQASR